MFVFQRTLVIVSPLIQTISSVCLSTYSCYRLSTYTNHIQCLSFNVLLLSSLHLYKPYPVFVFQCTLVIVSPRIQTIPVSLSCTSLCCSLRSFSPWCYNSLCSMLVCGRMPIDRHIFISVTSSFFTWELFIGTVSTQYSCMVHAYWMNMYAELE